MGGILHAGHLQTLAGKQLNNLLRMTTCFNLYLNVTGWLNVPRFYVPISLTKIPLLCTWMQSAFRWRTFYGLRASQRWLSIFPPHSPGGGSSQFDYTSRRTLDILTVAFITAITLLTSATMSQQSFPGQLNRFGLVGPTLVH